MKTVAVLLLAACAAGVRLLPCSLGRCSAWRGATPRELVADYVEARTASVFAGACHFNGEYTTQGRRAALALRVLSGRRAGVDLSGAACVAVVTSQDNLAEGGARRSFLYVPRSLEPARREALIALLRDELGSALGEIDRIESADVSFVRDGDAFRVRAGEAVRLEGAALLDRACCRMPHNVWYDPLVPLEGRVVGTSATFALEASELGPALLRHDENDAFLGTLRLGQPAS